MKIHIPDDSRVMPAIVTRTLAQAGYEGHDRIQAADDAEALDLLNRLRRDGDNAPSGFVTSGDSPPMRLLAGSAGALLLIAEPFTAETFRDALEPPLGCGQR